MLRVVEAISDANIGGAGRLLINRIKNTDREKFDIVVVLPRGSMLKSVLLAEGVKVYEINGGKDKSFDIKGFIGMLSVIRKLKPDIVNSHGSLNARFAAKICGVKVKLFTRHCDFPVKRIFKFRIVKRVFGFFNNFLSDGCIAVSESAKNNLQALGVNEEKIVVIINGAYPLRALSDSDREIFKKDKRIPLDFMVISIFARLESYKDHVTFLKAAALLKDGNYTFLIVGDGSEDKKIKAVAKELSLDDRVVFTGFVNDVTEWMNITDINVNCSVGTETSSLALSEGMSLGIPAVVSDYPGNTYMVKHNVNGLIFPQRDYATLAENIKRLSKDKKIYDRMRFEARSRFESELNAKSMTKATEAYYLKMYETKNSQD